MISEHDEQVGFVNWWRLRFPETLLFAIPNGEFRAITTAKKLKAEGVVPGIPDLYCPSMKLWIEMKKITGGTISQEQKSIHAYLGSIGDTVIVGYGATDASIKVLEYLNGRRICPTCRHGKPERKLV